MSKPITPEKMIEVADRCKRILNYAETSSMVEPGLQEICAGFLQLQAENELLNRCMSCEGIIDKPIVQCGCCAGIAYNNCDCSVTKQRDQAIADVKKLRNAILLCGHGMWEEGQEALKATKHYDE
jgi:hypothetical protein